MPKFTRYNETLTLGQGWHSYAGDSSILLRVHRGKRGTTRNFYLRADGQKNRIGSTADYTNLDELKVAAEQAREGYIDTTITVEARANTFGWAVEKTYQESTWSQLADNTRTLYKRWDRDYVLPYLRDVRMSKIGAFDFDAMKRDLIEKRSVGCWNDARKRVLMILNKHDCIVAIRKLGKIKPVREIPRERIATEEELARLVAHLNTLPMHWRAYWSLVLFTGQRADQCLNIRWSDVQNQTWIPDMATVKGGICPARNSFKPQAVIPLCDHLYDLLKMQHSLHPESDYIFPPVRPAKGRRPTIKPHMSGRNEHWKQVRKDLQLTDLTPHDLRRTFASYIELNHALSVAKMALGHASSRFDGITMAVYVQRSAEQCRPAFNDWANYLLGLNV